VVGVAGDAIQRDPQSSNDLSGRVSENWPQSSRADSSLIWPTLGDVGRAVDWILRRWVGARPWLVERVQAAGGCPVMLVPRAPLLGAAINVQWRRIP
jgi:hypothetical protein